MSRTGKGTLRIIEGIDGVGKTTQAHALYDALLKLGRPVIRVAEPGGTPMGNHLREVLLANDVKLDAEEMLLMFTLQRQYLLRTVIVPAIEAGTDIVADRSILSTLVYQTVQGIRRDRVIEVSREVIETLAWIPKQVCILDLEPHLAMERAHSEGATRTINHFDNGSLDEYSKRRERYLLAAESLNWQAYTHVIDASRPVEEITAELVRLASQ